MDSVMPPDDLIVAFGSIAIGDSTSATVTVGNAGNVMLIVGIVGGTRPLANPFSVEDDGCSASMVTAANPCTFRVVFAPSAAGSFADSLDIPSDDPDPAEDPVILATTGTGYLDTSPSPAVGGTSGGCFVATAAFGSADAWAVRTLRRFRDEMLMAGSSGRALVRGYYLVSPRAAAWIAERPSARFAARVMIAPAAALAWVLMECGVVVFSLLALLPCAVAVDLLRRRRRAR